jgi:uncharacterized protein YjiS (DUF1127 family)
MIQMSRLAKLLERRKQLLGYRRTRAEFEALPDVILSDIGIKRYQLGHAARLHALKP